MHIFEVRAAILKSYIGMRGHSNTRQLMTADDRHMMYFNNYFEQSSVMQADAELSL